MSIRSVALWHPRRPFGRRPTLTHESPALPCCISTASKDDGGLVDWPSAISKSRETMPNALNMARASAAHLRTPTLTAEIVGRPRLVPWCHGKPLLHGERRRRRHILPFDEQ